MQTRAKPSIGKILFMGLLVEALLLLAAVPVTPALAQRDEVPASGTLPVSQFTDRWALNLQISNRSPLFQPAGSPLSISGPSTSNWSTLSTGMNNPVFALSISGNNVYAGGGFNVAGDCTNKCNNIAKWDGSTWSPLGTGMNDSVNVIAVSGSTVYAGGRFTRAGTCTNGCNLIAKWDGSAWSPLGTGIDTYAEGQLNNYVSDIVISGNDLYVAGRFTSAGACKSGCKYIAKWDGSNWSALGMGMSGNGEVSKIVISGNNLYAGGTFTSAGNCTNGCNNIAKWNGRTWSALDTGTDGYIRAVAVIGSDVYVGGQFNRAGNCTNGCNGIAKWDGRAWSALGTGIINGRVEVIAFRGSDVYAGGSFSGAGNCTSYAGCNNIGKWDGSAWSGLGAGLGVNADIWAIVMSSGGFYAGGYFTGTFIQSGTTPTEYNRIAKYSLSGNADLSSLALSSGLLIQAFSSGNVAYTTSVASNVDSLIITPTKANVDASIRVRTNGGAWSAVPSGSPSSAYSLNMGTNLIEVQVIAADGRTNKTYTVTVIRPLPTPNPISPIGIITDTTPAYTWTAVSEASYYFLYVYPFESTSYVVYAAFLPASSICNGGTCTYAPATTLPTGKYQFRVRARNTISTCAYSDYKIFTVSP